MKRIGITFTILETVDLPDNYQEEDIEKNINQKLIDLGLNRNIVDDIEYNEINMY